MKTAQRILAISLDLFNQEGESSVTSVDIANELDISPGNLYYHFKGKELIVDALFELHTSQLSELLDKADTGSLAIDERFYYLYLLLEKIHLYRFFYRSPMDLMEKYPHVQKGLLKIVKQLEAKLTAVLEQSMIRKELRLERSELSSMVELVSLIIFQSSQYYQMKRRFDDETQIFNTLALLLNLFLPRLVVSNEHLAQLKQSLAAHTFSNGSI